MVKRMRNIFIVLCIFLLSCSYPFEDWGEVEIIPTPTVIIQIQSKITAIKKKKKAPKPEPSYDFFAWCSTLTKEYNDSCCSKYGMGCKPEPYP